MARNKMNPGEPFDCAECGAQVTPLTYKERPLVYNPDVVASGVAKPGPHCRRCVDKISRASAAKYRAAAFEREAARQARFANATKPAEMSDNLWSVLRSYACCPNATTNGCICAYSFTCPEHGTIHVGTHD